MKEKVITFAIPCFNSEEYMEKCVESLLPGGEDVEIIIVDDGSTDRTAEIADRYAARYPQIVRAIHQKNGGHGAAVNTGIANASGRFFKVVDSDDWADSASYRKVLRFLNLVIEQNQPLDLLVFNYVYEKAGAYHKKVMRPAGLPKGRFFGWKDVGHLQKAHYILMHSMVYRTELLRECGLKLPEHTFYVDNIFAFQPLPFVKTMYYMDVPFYRYFIGREDQSVNEKVMIRRINQQIRVNKIMVEIFSNAKFPHVKCFKYMRNYLEIVTMITHTILQLDGTKRAFARRGALWRYIEKTDPVIYHFLRHSLMVRCIGLPGKVGHEIVCRGYRVVRLIYGFN